MNTLKIENLPHSIELDRHAMTELMGCGLWSKVKKYGRKTGRYIEKRAQQKLREYKRAYRAARDVPGMLSYAPRGLYRTVRRWF
jgi:hypothetical protein